jgi:hypothetical protein
MFSKINLNFFKAEKIVIAYSGAGRIISWAACSPLAGS